MATTTNPHADIIGSGWAYPFKAEGQRGLHTDGRGGIALSRHDVDISESIQIILSTAKGERRMRPNFGCEIHNLIFAPNDASTWGLAAHYVLEALGWWEPRIEVTDVNPGLDPDDSSRMLIEVKYRIKATNDVRSIVYPFYLLTGRE